MTEASGPDYQRIADDIRARIRSGEYAIGAPIPSTPKLEKQYGVSKTPVRQAVDLLRREGVLAGQSGKAVYVRAAPEAAAAEQHNLKALNERVTGLARRIEDYEDLRDTVEHLRTDLIELYGKTAYDYPGHGEADEQQQHGRTQHG